MEEDIKIWREEIESIAIEVVFYQRILNSYLIKKNTLDLEKDVLFLDKMVSINRENQDYCENLISLKNKVVQLKECDDMQCEMHFLNKHAEFKSNIEMYFSEYRNFKKEIFVHLNEWGEEFV